VCSELILATPSSLGSSRAAEHHRAGPKITTWNNCHYVQVSVAPTCNPSYSGAEIRRTTVRSQSGANSYQTLSQRNPTQNRTGRVAQAVEHLSSRREALSSQPSTTEQNKTIPYYVFTHTHTHNLKKKSRA
jgi:hypothetical protein